MVCLAGGPTPACDEASIPSTATNWRRPLSALRDFASRIAHASRHQRLYPRSRCRQPPGFPSGRRRTQPQVAQDFVGDVDGKWTGGARCSKFSVTGPRSTVTLAGSITMPSTSASTPPTAIPTSRNGSSRIHTSVDHQRHHASGQQSTSRMHHSRNLATPGHTTSVIWVRPCWILTSFQSVVAGLQPRGPRPRYRSHLLCRRPVQRALKAARSTGARA
jgi:hypothetical protein